MTAANKKEAYDRWVVQNNYYHKKFSIYGDSISTLSGYQPPEYRVFYEGEHCSQSGIYKMKDTWWGKVIDFFSGELLVNNSYSGCRVSKLPDNLSSNTDFFPSGCSQKRIQQLGTNTQAPDVIIIYMGTNDYGFGVPVAAPPSALPVEEHLDFFENAYLFMLQNIRMKYPNCEIWCCTLCPGRVQGSVYSTFPYRVGKNFFRDFNQVIQNAANLHNCRLIDFPSFSKDYEAIDGTHPTKKGMSQLAEMVIRSVSPEAVRFLSDDENIGKIVCGKYRIEDTIHRSTAPSISERVLKPDRNTPSR